MNINKSLFVNLSNSAIEAVESHISEKPTESRIVFFNTPS